MATNPAVDELRRFNRTDYGLEIQDFTDAIQDHPCYDNVAEHSGTFAKYQLCIMGLQVDIQYGLRAMIRLDLPESGEVRTRVNERKALLQQWYNEGALVLECLRLVSPLYPFRAQSQMRGF